MFWNKSKKSQPNNSPPVTAASAAKTTKLPLSFLKRLIPINHLADNELLQLKITLSKHNPGDIIFNHNEPSNSLSYIVKGQCYIVLDRQVLFTYKYNGLW
ncbi:MAG: hypothetical protein ACKE51_06335 [Methylococcaceae bacterium]